MEISFLNQNILIILFGLKLLIKLKRKKRYFIYHKWEERRLGLESIRLYLRPQTWISYRAKGKNQQAFFYSWFLKLVSETYNIKISESTIEDVKSVSSLPWKDIVIQAFISLDGSASLNDIYTWIEKHEPRPLTENWKATTRRTIYNYCKDRNLFLGKEELFEALNSSSYRLI